MNDTSHGHAPKPHVLRERNMRWYLGTQLISLTGLMLRTSVLALLIVDMLGKDRAATYVGLVRSMELIPGALLGIFVGMAIDRLEKRNVLYVTGSITILQSVALALLSCQPIKDIPIWAIMLISFIGGFTNVIDGVARNSIVKDAVKHPENARMGATYFTALYTFAMLAGNGLAGYLITWIGYGDTFVLNGISLLVLMFGLYRLDLSHVIRHQHPKEHPLAIAKNGVRYCMSDKGVLACIAIGSLFTVFGFGYNVILPVANKTMFHGGPQQYSHLAAMAGLGSLIGVIMTLLWSEHRARMFILGGCLISGVGNLLLSRAADVSQGSIALFLCGFGFMMGYTPIRGAITHIVKPHLISLVMGTNFMFFYTGMIISSLGSGFIATHYGCPAVFATSGCLLIVIALVAPFIPGWKRMG